VTAFAIKGDLDVSAIKNNTFEIEWPPKSGKMHLSDKSIARRGSICRPRTSKYLRASGSARQPEI
jgi:predicted NUDIX family NTP pyrophosphohydrolase